MNKNEDQDYPIEITIAWIDLTLNIKLSIFKRKTIRVLNNISGYFHY